MSTRQRAARGPVERLGGWLSRYSERFIPDPFVLTILLTLVAFALGLIFWAPEPAGFGDRVSGVLGGWLDAFFRGSLLTFAFQMCLVLVTGHALATSPPVQRLVSWLAGRPKNSAQAVFLVAWTAVVSGYIHWGLGAVVGAFLAREIGRASAREGRPVHYPLLGAAAYGGLLVWHGGLSGSAPLKVAEADHFLVELTGVIPTSETIFSGYNVVVTVVLLVLVPSLFRLLTPRDPASFVAYSEPDGAVSQPKAVKPRLDTEVARPASVADALENGRALAWLIGITGLGWIVYSLADGVVARGQLDLTLNTVNFLFLFLGILLQGTPRRYVEAAADGARGCAGIIVQFPFYFGILGVLQASGLVDAFANAMVNVATETTLPLLTFFSAGVVNLFVPSGGGQWAVQGEILMAATQRLGANVEQTIMAFCYGDQLTNMLQPFWALPLLGITGLKARQVIGYTGAVMLLVTPALVVLLLVL